MTTIPPAAQLATTLRLAGGLTRCANDNSVFLIWTNGSVSSSLQVSGGCFCGSQIAGLVTALGDMIFLPEEPNKASWFQKAKVRTQILYPLGIGIADMKSAVN